MAIDKAKLNDLSHYGASLTNLLQTVTLLLDIPADKEAEDVMRTVSDIVENIDILVVDIIATM